MKTPIGNLLRWLADQFDEGNCDLDSPALMKVAELQLKDHQRLNELSDLLIRINHEHQQNHPDGDDDCNEACRIVNIN